MTWPLKHAKPKGKASQQDIFKFKKYSGVLEERGPGPKCAKLYTNPAAGASGGASTVSAGHHFHGQRGPEGCLAQVRAEEASAAQRRSRARQTRPHSRSARRARKKAAAIAERAQEAAEDAATAAAAVDNEAAPASDSAAPALDVQDAALEM